MAAPTMARPRRGGFQLGTVFALLLVVLAVGYMIWGETPTGRVEGVVVLTDYAGRPLADADVYLNPEGDNGGDGRRHRYAKTDRAGRFVLSHVVAGSYTLSASSRY